MSNCWYKDVCNLHNSIECSESCIRYSEMKYLLDNSNLPVNKYIPDKLIPEVSDLPAFTRLAEIRDNIVDFVNNGNNLYIISKHTGNGKTSWSIKLMLRYFNEIWAGNGFKVKGIYLHTPTLLTQIKGNFTSNNPIVEKVKQNLLNVDLVIWDDIASTGLSQFDHSQLLMYIDQRLLAGKSNIYTGNLQESELYKVLGERLTSRIYDSEIITLYGKDRRYGTTTNNIKDISN